jgi:excisionase family DNA binding protein
MSKTFLREKEQAATLNVSRRTLRDWRAQGIIPFLKIRRVVLYNPEAVLAALAKFERIAK